MLFYFYPFLILIHPYALVALLWLILRNRLTERKWFPALNQPKITYFYLIGFLLTGFFFKLDYSLQQSCFVRHESVFSSENIFFFTIALTLLTIGILVRSKKIAATFLIIELIFWLYKLFLIKGGYAVGVAGAPNPFVLFYDILVLMLRIELIKQILCLKFRKLYVLGISFLIMLIKFYILCFLEL